MPSITVPSVRQRTNTDHRAQFSTAESRGKQSSLISSGKPSIDLPPISKSWVETNSFTMLTMNAYDHPVMRDFHKAEDEKRSTTIPANFPSSSYQSSLAGAQPKIAMVEVDGKYYSEGNTPDQQLERYLMCEDLAQQGSVYCNRKIGEGAEADGSDGEWLL